MIEVSRIGPVIFSRISILMHIPVIEIPLSFELRSTELLSKSIKLFFRIFQLFWHSNYFGIFSHFFGFFLSFIFFSAKFS